MSDEDDRTCYVCNFVPEVTSDLLEELFTQVSSSDEEGPPNLDVSNSTKTDALIRSVVRFDPVGPVEKLKLTDKNSYRFAMVTFEDEESVPFAVETLDGIKLFQIPLTVKPRNGSRHDKRSTDSVRRDSYGSSHSSPHSDSRKRDHMGRTLSYDERLTRNYSAPRHDMNPVFTPPIPPPPPPPPPIHSESYPSLKTRAVRAEGYATPKSSFSGRPGGDQRRTFPSKPSDSRVFEGETNGYDSWRGGGRGNQRDYSRYSRRSNSGHRWH